MQSAPITVVGILRNWTTGKCAKNLTCVKKHLLRVKVIFLRQRLENLGNAILTAGHSQLIIPPFQSPTLTVHFSWLHQNHLQKSNIFSNSSAHIFARAPRLKSKGKTISLRSNTHEQAWASLTNFHILDMPCYLEYSNQVPVDNYFSYLGGPEDLVLLITRFA